MPTILRFINGTTAPSGLTLSAVAGGTLVPGTYGYKVATVTAEGESPPSAEVTITTSATGTVRATWTPVPGATAYRVYGRTAGGPWGRLAEVTTTSYDDTGAATLGTNPATGYPLRLDLNDPAGFVLTQGLDLGEPPLEQSWLSQTPHAGALLTAAREDITTMTVPVWLSKQSSWATLQALLLTLRTELTRTMNVLEYRPVGATSSFFIDTYRSPVPSLFRGQASPTPAIYLHDTQPMPLTIYRHPVMRGAAAHI